MSISPWSALEARETHSNLSLHHERLIQRRRLLSLGVARVIRRAHHYSGGAEALEDAAHTERVVERVSLSNHALTCMQLENIERRYVLVGCRNGHLRIADALDMKRERSERLTRIDSRWGSKHDYIVSAVRWVGFCRSNMPALADVLRSILSTPERSCRALMTAPSAYGTPIHCSSHMRSTSTINLRVDSIQ